MDLLDKVVQNQMLMMEAYRDFQELVRELKDDRGLGNNDFASFSAPADYSFDMEEEESESKDDAKEEAAEQMPMMPLMESLYGHECQDFPMQQSFSREEINPEDPAFWSGKSIGIPVAVVVRQTDGQDKLLPIRNGMFTEI